MSNPYKIEGPALISFSGGRTSAFMLWNILQAHGGVLPDDIYVTFANTGKEAPETLDFVHEIEQKWDVKIYCWSCTLVKSVLYIEQRLWITKQLLATVNP